MEPASEARRLCCVLESCGHAAASGRQKDAGEQRWYQNARLLAGFDEFQEFSWVQCRFSETVRMSRDCQLNARTDGRRDGAAIVGNVATKIEGGLG